MTTDRMLHYYCGKPDQEALSSLLGKYGHAKVHHFHNLNYDLPHGQGCWYRYGRFRRFESERMPYQPLWAAYCWTNDLPIDFCLKVLGFEPQPDCCRIMVDRYHFDWDLDSMAVQLQEDNYVGFDTNYTNLEDCLQDGSLAWRRHLQEILDTSILQSLDNLRNKAHQSSILQQRIARVLE